MAGGFRSCARSLPPGLNSEYRPSRRTARSHFRSGHECSVWQVCLNASQQRDRQSHRKSPCEIGLRVTRGEFSENCTQPQAGSREFNWGRDGCGSRQPGGIPGAGHPKAVPNSDSLNEGAPGSLHSQNPFRVRCPLWGSTKSVSPGDPQPRNPQPSDSGGPLHVVRGT